MYKNQLQELAQRSCFNLPSYSCIREGPDHAPRFKVTVNFNGETFESPTFCSTLRQAEHAAAEVALNTLASRGPSRALAARVLDETGVYKNLLQETAQKAGLKLPAYTTVRAGPSHVAIFSCTVELAGMRFTGEPARTKKQAQKNAAIYAWSALKRMVQHGSSSSSLSSSVETEKGNEEQEQVIVARLLASLKPSELKNSNRSDWQQGQHRFIPVSNQLTETTPSLYTTQCRYWEGDNFSPKVSLYQLSQQEHLLLLQNHLLTLHVPPATPNPQILPYMHPILPQESSLFVPMREKQTIPVRPLVTIAMSAPSLYFSNHVVPDPIHGKSMVTIQEVQEEKIEESSNLMVSENSVQDSLNAEPKFKDLVHEEDNHKSIEQKIKVENVKGGENRAGRSERASDGSEQAANNLVDFQGQNSSTVGFLPGPLNPPRSSLPCNYRPSVAVPVMIRNAESTPSVTPHIIPNVGPVSSVLKPPRMRTGIPPYRARLESQRMDMGVVRPRFMAPAVCIRSVVPVCSAPPPRKISNSSQELVLPNKDQKDTIPQDL